MNHKFLIASVRYVLLILGILCFCSLFLMGQLETGSVAGTVRDSSDAIIPDANIVVKNIATNAQRATMTGNIGEYTVPGLLPGKYEISISKKGFNTFTVVTDVTVGSHVTVDAKLNVGAEATIVEVVGGGIAQVNTETQEVSQLIDPNQMAQLPSLTRNPYDFIAISGNVSGGDSTTPNASGSQNATSRGVGFSINGQRESGTEILLDGLENVDLFNAVVGMQVPVDALQEYRVITNNFGAEYGRASGGVVNVTTSPATNNYHGTVWEFNRLSAYTANTYANDASGVPKGVYTRNQFGFMFGGPIVKNKLFATLSTEWLRVRSQALETEEILDPSFINGTCPGCTSGLPANIQSYFNAYGTGAPPTSGVVTAGQLASKGLNVNPINGVVAVPASAPVFDIVNFKAPFDAGGSLPQNTYLLSGRLDFNMSDKTQMFFRFARDYETDFMGADWYSPYPQYDVGGTTSDNSGVFSLSHSYTPTVFSNTKIGFSRFVVWNSFNTALTYTPNLMLGANADPYTNNLIQFPGVENIGPGSGGLPYGGPQNTLQLEHDVSWTKGRHEMKVGGQFTYIQMNKAYGAYAQSVEQLGAALQDGMNGLVNTYGNPGGAPLITFTARLDPNGVLPCAATPVYWATLSTSDLIQTQNCAVTPPLAAPSYARSYRYKDWAVYAEDSLKLTPRLTLNYGLRYEHYGVQHNNDQALDSNFYYGSGAGLYEQVRNGGVSIADKSSVGQFWEPRWGTAAPRVGFAWDVMGDGKTSIRGGFGLSYERNFGNVTFNASFNPPSSAVLNSVCASTPAALKGCSVLVTNNDLGPLGQPGPPSYLPPAEIRMPDPRINVSQTQFWSLSVDREIARNTMMEIGYSGAHGVHLYDIENINLWGAGNVYLGDNYENANCNGPKDAATGNYLCYTRPNDQYSNINLRGSLGTSSYNALNFRFQTQNVRNTGLTLVANYTWSHSLDDLSSTFSDTLQGGSNGYGSLGYTNVLDPKLDWGSSDFDIRQRLVVSPIWATPWFKNNRGIKGEALGGWGISSVIMVRTGVPFSVFDLSNELNYYTVPRLTPMTPITSFSVHSPQAVGANEFSLLTLPSPAALGPLNPTLGISDFGPFPADMTHRNAFRGPGAWTNDFGLTKNFKLTERFGMEFRAEGFDLFNHHNYYINGLNLYYSSQGPGATMATGSNDVIALKGGLGSLAIGGNHDERRFGQFSLRLNF
jgi:hypothetical protein